MRASLSSKSHCDLVYQASVIVALLWTWRFWKPHAGSTEFSSKFGRRMLLVQEKARPCGIFRANNVVHAGLAGLL